MQTALDFGCRRAPPKPAQHSDYNRVSGAEMALFEGENAFFRCRQRNQGRAALAILSSASLPISHEGDCLAAMDAPASIIVQAVHGVDALRDFAAKRDIRATPGAARPAGRCGNRLRCLRGHRYLTFAALAENRDWLCGLVQQWGFIAAFLYIAVYADPGLKSPFSLFFDP